MNAAWGGISEEKEITLCISAEHKTTKNILHRKAFTISMAEAAYTAACDYIGIVSGNQVPDKFLRAGFHAIPSEFVNAPLIAELAIAVECKLKSYDAENCHMVGEIVNVSIDERALTPEGKVMPDRIKPITFDPFNNTYLVLGEPVGQAFSIGTLLQS